MDTTTEVDAATAAAKLPEEPSRAEFGGKLVPVDRIEDYVLGEIIGEGCFGTVQRATHRTTGHVVALKRIILTQLSTFDAEQALRNEVAAMAQLSHEEEHVVQLRAVIMSSSRTNLPSYLVLECCDGDLSKLIADCAQPCGFSEERVRALMIQLATGMRSFRTRGIIHRDLKPSNLMLVGQAVAVSGWMPFSATEWSLSGLKLKIGDLGFARHLSEGGFALSYKGAPSYMAPEILQHLPYDEKCDLYSAGVIMYQLLTNTLPLDEAAILHRNWAVPDVNSRCAKPVSAACSELLQMLLQADPAHRCSFDEFLGHRFLQLPLLISPPVAERPSSHRTAMGMKSGWLRKKGAVNPAFRRRWFTLCQALNDETGRCVYEMRYFSDEETEAPKGVIVLRDGAVRVKTGPDECVFELHARFEGSPRSFVLAADSADETEAWVEKLRGLHFAGAAAVVDIPDGPEGPEEVEPADDVPPTDPVALPPAPVAPPQEQVPPPAGKPMPPTPTPPGAAPEWNATIELICALGYSAEDATAALESCGGDVKKAIDELDKESTSWTPCKVHAAPEAPSPAPIPAPSPAPIPAIVAVVSAEPVVTAQPFQLEPEPEPEPEAVICRNCHRLHSTDTERKMCEWHGDEARKC
jgi:serine/threonine protein kinase